LIGNYIGGVMVSVLASGEADRGFELSAWVFLNVEVRVKHPWLNHDGKIFKNTSTSYLKNNLIKINEHNKHNR
jgi:hypothetical protein